MVVAKVEDKKKVVLLGKTISSNSNPHETPLTIVGAGFLFLSDGKGW